MSLDKAKEVLDELLKSLGLSEYTIAEDEVDDVPTLSIDTEDHALLIGRHGDNLRSLQHIFNAILRHQDREAGFIALDVAQYKKSRVEKLQIIASEAADKARAEKSEVRLRPMNAYERRQVHMVLADEADLVTESVGQEPYRSIVVRPRD